MKFEDFQKNTLRNIEFLFIFKRGEERRQEKRREDKRRGEKTREEGRERERERRFWTYINFNLDKCS